MAARNLFILYIASILIFSFCLTVPCSAQDTVPVTITTVPSGLQITVDDAAYTAPQVFQWTSLSGHTLGAPSPQSGGPGIQYLFDLWSNGEDQYHTIFTPYEPVTYTATFITRHELTTPMNISLGGSVRPDCTLGCWYDSGESVSLIALPGNGYAFDQWTGDCTGTNPSVSVTMTAPRTCQVNLLQCSDPSSVRIGATGYPSFESAYQIAVNNDIIKMLATNLRESLSLNRSNIKVTLQGGYRCWEESTPSSYTLLQGHMIFKEGAGIVENLMILSGTPPMIISFEATSATVPAGSPSMLSWTVADATEVSIDNGVGDVDPINGTVNVYPSITTTYTLTATNPYGTDTAQVVVTSTPQITTFKAEPDVISSGGSSTLTWQISGAISVVIDQGIGEVDPASGSVSVSPTTTTVYTITVTNAAGTITKKITVGVIPPDPASIAPPIDQAVATTVYDASSFLYTSPTPVQTGMAPETIEPKRASVLRGKVLGGNGVPLSGVTVTLLNHREYGQTITRTDGMFDMVVNGGGLMNVKYTKTGYLTVQRQRDIPWQDFMWLPEIRMIEADPNVTIVDLISQSDFQVVRGSVITDERGTRQSTVLIPKGTQAWMVFPDGHEEPITSLTVRATEFTVGTDGESKMPAELPPSSAYTYCEEFTVEEAVAAGAPEVRFSQMAISYNENFLNFPVGTGIPLGAYDRELGVWIPSNSGKVIKIVSINNGLAELDTDGNGTIDNGVSLGITDAERAALVNLYSIGQSLWRVLVPHFTRPWDKNMGTSCEEPCDNPNMPPPGPKEPTCPNGEQANNKQPGSSIILCQSQALAEDVPITGTPYYLHYQSDRSRGMAHKYQISIPLTGASISPSLRRVYLQIEVAGNKIVRSFAPAANLTDTFTWNGKDAYGRIVQGRQPITVRIGYAFKLVYTATDRFGYNGGGTVMVTDNQFIMWQVHQGWIGTLDAQGQGLGGWMLNLNHFYDSNGKMLYQGDGVSRDATSMPGIITTVAGTGCQAGFGCPYEPYGDGGPAIYAPLNSPRNIALGQDGSLFIATGSRIRRVATDGIITTVAGVCSGGCVYNGYSGEGGPATQAQLGSVYGIKVGPDGSLFIADHTYARIFRVGPDGIITTVAGTGAYGYSGDGGPAINAQFLWPTDLAIGQDGSLYVSDSGNYRIRRVGTDGIITTVAGTGAYGCSGDGGPAVNATLRTYDGNGLAVGPDGSLYIADSGNHVIRRVGPDGIISTVAGGNCMYPGYSGDGTLATNARLNVPLGVSIGPDGSIYLSDSRNSRIRRVGPDGIINTIAGNGSFGYSGDGGSALDASFGTYSNPPTGIEAGHDGNLYIADLGNSVIRRVASVFPGLQVSDFSIASDDGSQVFFFNSSGKHLKTINSLTGANLYQFGYDANGLLSTVTDGDGNVTTVERDSNGNPTAIVGPYGQRTTLILDANGYLASVTNPASESTSFQYTSDGMITKMTTPRGHDYIYTYDALGRLTKDEDPSGGSKSLSRTEITNGYQVEVTTAMGRSTNYSVDYLPIGDQHMVNTYPDGTKVDTLDRKNGSSTVLFPDGTTLGSLLGPDPRFGMQAPLMKSGTIVMPSGLTATSTTVRTATLLTPGNPLTLTSLKDEVTINGQKYTTNYTASTKTITAASPVGRQETSKIDLQGREVEYQIAGLLPIQFTYDVQGRLKSAIQGAGGELRESTFEYNVQGFPHTVTDSLVRTLTFEYDLAGRVTRAVLPDNGEITYAYDANGNMTSLTPPGRPPHVFTYNPVDATAEYIPPDIGIGTVKTQYSYNTDRQLTKVLRPDGIAIDFGYDSGGRLSSVTYPGGPLTYTYDPAKGYITNVNGPGGNSISYAYDGVLMTSKSWTGDVTGSVSRTYDNNFRITGISINSGNAITYQYDNDSLVTKAGDLTLSRSAQNGFLTGSTLGNVTDAWTYNSFGEPESYAANYSATEIFKQQFTYDKIGRIAQKIETVEGTPNTYDYIYDPAGRLKEVKKNGSTVSTYTYDSNDNRLTGPSGATTYTYDAQDRLVQRGTSIYTYTANGELQNKTSGGQATLYSYDVFGNLKSVSLPGGTLIEYIVDGQNRRLGKKVNGSWFQKLLYLDGLKPVAELDESNNVTSLFIYGSRQATPYYMIKGGITYRIISDHLGSPRLVVDTVTGAVVQRMEYDEFGNVVQNTSPGFQPFGFAGGTYDHETKLVRSGARDYDAEIGRWTSKDSVRFIGRSANLYVYAGSDPVNWIDSDGSVKKMPYYDPLENKIRWEENIFEWRRIYPGLTTPKEVGKWQQKVLELVKDKLKLSNEEYINKLRNIIRELDVFARPANKLIKCIGPLLFAYELLTGASPAEAAERRLVPFTIEEIQGAGNYVSSSPTVSSWAENIKWNWTPDWLSRLTNFLGGGR